MLLGVAQILNDVSHWKRTKIRMVHGFFMVEVSGKLCLVIQTGCVILKPIDMHQEKETVVTLATSCGAHQDLNFYPLGVKG